MPFQVTNPVHTFKVGDIVHRHQFPQGTDFARLVKLKCLRPIEGEAAPIADDDLEGWKQRVEFLEEQLRSEPSHAAQQSLKALGEDYGELSKAFDLAKDELAAEQASHAADVAELKGQIEKLQQANNTPEQTDYDFLATWTREHGIERGPEDSLSSAIICRIHALESLSSELMNRVHALEEQVSSLSQPAAVEPKAPEAEAETTPTEPVAPEATDAPAESTKKATEPPDESGDKAAKKK